MIHFYRSQAGSARVCKPQALTSLVAGIDEWGQGGVDEILRQKVYKVKGRMAGIGFAPNRRDTCTIWVMIAMAGSKCWTDSGSLI